MLSKRKRNKFKDSYFTKLSLKNTHIIIPAICKYGMLWYIPKETLQRWLRTLRLEYYPQLSK